jgi:uncharacterized membrane protein YeaQ/YmgE (transglycosylase-associated protein family)
MTSAIVISWVGIGAFVAWIATHLRKDRRPNALAANLLVGVAGALVGGLVMRTLLDGGKSYFVFLMCAVAAFIVSSFVIKLTRLANRGETGRRVT